MHSECTPTCARTAWSGHLPRAACIRLQLPAAHQHQVEHGGRARRGVRRLRPSDLDTQLRCRAGADRGARAAAAGQLSTMALLRNGRSNSSRTRHIDIRYFFMSDRMAAGEVVLPAH
jgi:hypothetical protein